MKTKYILFTVGLFVSMLLSAMTVHAQELPGNAGRMVTDGIIEAAPVQVLAGRDDNQELVPSRKHKEKTSRQDAESNLLPFEAEGNSATADDSLPHEKTVGED